MAKGADWGFVGQSYQAPALYQDAEVCVNWYCELDQNKGAKTPIALLGCPGLQLATSIGNGPVRGCWSLPGGTQALWVSGNQLYLMSVPVAGMATASSFATFKTQLIGTLSTNTAPVVLRDDGAGGYTWIVDGPNGYLYNNATQVLAPITDPGFLGSNRIAFIDGWQIFNQPGTQTFYTNYPQYGTLPFNASYYALKDGATDNLITIYESKEELWLVGEKTTEIWFDVGGQYFPFQRLVSTMLQVGCAAVHSIVRFSSQGQDGLMWLGESERGEYVFVKTQGFSAVTVSTPAISDAIRRYPIISDCIGYSYQEDGHEFGVFSFPTADVTWCYDGSTNLWHQRLSYDPVAGLWHRHRSNCHTLFQGQHLVGDYQNGNIYVMSREVYSDNGLPLVAWRRSPHVWDGGSRRRMRYRELQLDFRMGVGLSTGQGSSPRAALSWSDYDGMPGTFKNLRYLPLGNTGEGRARCVTRRLGCSELGHSRVFDVQVSDPVSRDCVGATLIAGSGA